MVATPNSVKLFGAVPVFVDVEPETLCLDIDLVRNAITPKTKALMLVSANGRYPKSGIQKLEKLCNEYNLILIEDAAQSLGSFYPDGRHIGRAGMVGSFSFSMPKIITTGQGGALITDDDEVALNLLRLKDFGREKGGLDIHDSIGFNFKFTDLQAVLGIEQMKKLTWRIERKKNIMRLYQENLDHLNQLEFFEQNLKNTTPWFIDVMTENRDNLMEYLKKCGIGTRVMYPPLNEQKAYRISGHYPVSKSVGEKGLWLPSASQLTDEQVINICKKFSAFYQ
jgi:perosamine synthetase